MPRKYKGILFLLITLVINIVTILQSALPGNLSSAESGRITTLFVQIGNLFTKEKVEIIKPVSLTLEETTPLVYGESRRITPIFEPSDTTNKTLKWESSDESTIKVTSGGVMVAEGELNKPVTIKATSIADPTIYAEIEVIIRENPTPTNFVLSVTKSTQLAGLTSKISISNIEPRFADVNKIKYEVSEPFASIDKEGIVRSSEPGLIKVTAYTEEDPIENNVPFSETLEIEFLPNDDPIIEPEEITINGPTSGDIYSYVKLEASFGGVIPSDEAITWSTLNNYIGDISFVNDEEMSPLPSDGKSVYIYGRKFAGTTTIRATSNYDPSIYKDFKITFKEVLPLSLHIKINETIITLGKSQTLNVDFGEILPTVREVKFTRSNEKVVIIENKGDYAIMKAVGVGTVNVSVTSVANPELKEMVRVTITSLSEEQVDDMHAFLRKAFGHFSLYLINAIFSMLAIWYFFNITENKLAAIFGSGFGVFMAFFTEFIQTFIPARAGLIQDGIINFSGFLLGIIIFYTVKALYNYYLKRKLDKKDNKTI